jgi:GTP 3',8-cyclase
LWDYGKVLLADDMLAMLSSGIGALSEDPNRDPKAPATDYSFEDGIGRVGFIASVSKPFCGNCNRLRLTADGKLRYCLFAIEEFDVRTCLRNGGSAEELAEIIRMTIHLKWIGHQINKAGFVAPPRPMYAIGG